MASAVLSILLDEGTLRENVIRQRAEKISYAYSLDATRKDPTGLCNMTQSFCATSSSTSERQHKPRIFDLSDRK